MRVTLQNVLTGADTATLTGAAIKADQMISASFHVFFGDATAVGTTKIQASNDATIAPSNWVDVPSATAAATSGSSGLITIAQCSYQWLRVVFTYTSGGSSTINVNMKAFGV